MGSTFRPTSARRTREFLAGFLIALAIALTGVGGGVITAPVLMLFFGVLPARDVGTSLLFAAIIKLLVVPVYMRRGLVNYGILGWMVLGGLPGVLAGGALLKTCKRMETTAFFTSLWAARLPRLQPSTSIARG